ncbi:MAG TPA: sulfatase [Thermoanaerobaculia bacterium]|nr:sulfatase [Thermoanaerobaculia bacterium]
MSRRLLFLVWAGLAFLTACGDSSPRRLIRLGSLVETGEVEPVSLPAGVATPEAVYRAKPGLSAARVARLRLRAQGSATLATLSWKLAGDRGFPPFRTLSFPLAADGQEHAYEVDLQREPYWTGRVEVLRLAVNAGRLEILEITGEPATDPYRSMSLGGESRPALPGLARTEIRLPEDLPRGAIFEAWLGIVPEHDRPGTRAVFRVWREADGRRDLWLEEVVEGSGGRQGWRAVRKEMPRGGGRLALEVEATRRGRPLPEGVALWGDPVIVTPGRALEKKSGKNLVVVLIDTLRADRLGAYGNKNGLTPNLDRFAAEAVRFDQMQAPAGWTLPSVASLMTGLQPQMHGAGVRYGEFAPTGLTGGVRTLAETLRDAGFYNLGVYHNIYVNPAFGLQQGFDEYVSIEDRAAPLVDRALAGLRRTAPDRRVFLYLHLFDVHNPYEPPEEECQSVARRLLPGYQGKLGCAADRRPELPIPPPEDRRWHEALYDAEIAYTDRQMGRFLEGLEELGLDDDTVVLVVSDHGEEFWTRLDRERALGYEPNSDHGHTLYEELLHVPALLRVPGRSPGVIESPADLADLFPTLLRLVGVQSPPVQGRDLTPLLDGEPPAGRPTLLADLILHGPPRWSVRRGPWKLIVPREPGPPPELYDLDRDPGELRDLAAARPDLVDALRAAGERELGERGKGRARFVSGDGAQSATYLEWNHITRLRSLGYLK